MNYKQFNDEIQRLHILNQYYYVKDRKINSVRQYGPYYFLPGNNYYNRNLYFQDERYKESIRVIHMRFNKKVRNTLILSRKPEVSKIRFQYFILSLKIKKMKTRILKLWQRQ